MYISGYSEYRDLVRVVLETSLAKLRWPADLMDVVKAKGNILRVKNAGKA